MKKIPNNFLSAFRWFVMIGVAFGLFFSSGEGIRLLPFPAATSEKISGHFDIGNSNLYSLSACNSVAHSGLIKSKYQKDPQCFDRAGGRHGDEFRSLIIFYSASRQNYRQPVFSNRQIYSAIPTDRAPPVI